MSEPQYYEFALIYQGLQNELSTAPKSKLNMKLVNHIPELFNLLHNGDVDYAVCGLYPCKIRMAVLGYQDKISVLNKYIVVENFHMAFVKTSEFKHLLPKANEIIKRYAEAGTIEQWLQDYLNVYQLQRIENNSED